MKPLFFSSNFMKSEICKAIIKASGGTHRDVARVFILMLGHVFTAQLKDGKVYIFHRKSIDAEEWTESSTYHLKYHLSSEVSMKFYECSRLVFSKAFNDKNELLKPQYIQVAMNLIKVANLLKNGTYKAHICREVLEMLACR
jgi:hypothetical protein